MEERKRAWAKLYESGPQKRIFALFLSFLRCSEIGNIYHIAGRNFY